MKQFALIVLATSFLVAGCATPTAVSLSQSSTRMTAQSKLAYQECLATDPSTIKLLGAMQTFMQANAWKTSLSSIQTVASRPVSNGTEFLVTGVFSAGFNYEATVLAAVDASGAVLFMKDASTSGVSIQPLPFKKVTAAQLKAIQPKVAAFLKSEWKAEFVSLLKGTVLSRKDGDVFRLDAAIQTQCFPIAVEQNLEVRFDAQGKVVAVEGI